MGFLARQNELLRQQVVFEQQQQQKQKREQDELLEEQKKRYEALLEAERRRAPSQRDSLDNTAAEAKLDELRRANEALEVENRLLK